ncbi:MULTISPECIES: hypothetical protein [Hyphomonas]|jgi:hypothetical protein|uniref:hypothetical protein n=1 Tax=Hyphomonas TaxID=85 RepID=UPI003517C204
MADDRRQFDLQRLRELGLDLDSSQDEAEVKSTCRLTQDCIEAGDNSLTLNQVSEQFSCSNCGASGSFRELVRALETGEPASSPVVRDIVDTDFSVAPIRATRAVVKTEPRVVHLGEGQRVRSQGEIRREAKAARKAARQGRHTGEKIIITLLALVFLGAGLAAAGLSGFANYQAFSSSVADPLQSGVWGWTGVIAAVISFGGFTFFYWHSANGRMKEGIRALLFALAGGGTSIVGTQMYIAANNRAAEAELVQAGSNRDVLEMQITDWRRQLEGIPPETRSVEGLEAYLAEVERVGRTHQKPYRDAQNELGLARRRDDLQARIDAANAELLGTGSGDILVQAQTRTSIPGWFFALMLELFSSQGTSIGLVALLILYGRNHVNAAADSVNS